LSFRRDQIASADFEQMIFETMMELNIVPAEMAALDMSSVVGSDKRWAADKGGWRIKGRCRLHFLIVVIVNIGSGGLCSDLVSATGA
jgi:hypothetical protein